jgi:signal transduction histidine kinase
MVALRISGCEMSKVVILKLGIIFIAIMSFFWLFVFGPFYDSIVVQLVVFIVVMGWNVLRFSIQEAISLLKFCLPFVLSLFVFGLIFHFMQLFGRTDWLEDTLIKCFVFPSSLVFLKILLTYITYLDILNLPISMKKRIGLITMKSAFQKGEKILRRFSWYLNTYSDLQSGSRIKSQLQKYACLIIALYLYLYEEIENSNRLLKNKYHHLYEVNE